MSRTFELLRMIFTFYISHVQVLFVPVNQVRTINLFVNYEPIITTEPNSNLDDKFVRNSQIVHQMSF